MNLLQNVKITQVVTIQADGQATASGTILDMSGYEGVMFIASFGDVDDTSVLTLQVQQDNLNAAGGMATLTGTSTYTAGATDADDDLLVIDIYRPLKRYVRCQVVSATANAIVGNVSAIQYGNPNARKVPITQGSTVLDSNTYVSPAEA